MKVERRVKKMNLDLTYSMADELDLVAEGLNVSRQAVIKVILRHALDEMPAAAAARQEQAPKIRGLLKTLRENLVVGRKKAKAKK